MLNQKWEEIVEKLDFAFQAIVNTTTGKIYAVEALLRNYHSAGFNSIFNCFDEAFHEGMLYQFDLALRKKAIKKFTTIDINKIQMFYNLDNRLLYMPDYSPGNTSKILDSLDVDKESICFEMSERGTLQNPNAITTMLNRYKQEGFDIAIDDFGTGISGLQLLYYSETNFIKLDRFFIQNISNDSKKRLFCSSIVDMAHIMGIKVIAEGVEEEKEFLTCKDIGIDFIQGFLIQKPQTDVEKLKIIYEKVKELNKKDKRIHHDNVVDKEYISYIKPIKESASLHELFVYFKENPNNNFVPIVDNNNHLIGVVYEVDIKRISYSQYGLSLAKNISFSSKLSTFIKPALSVELAWGIDKTLEIYNMCKNSSKGIFISKENAYYGFIDVNNLLSLSYKRNLEIAKNQNPLTKLPGNQQIRLFMEKCFKKENKETHHIVYFDFNDFKPFNDYYGFRQGDRAILLFSELLQKTLPESTFVAHIGGDDFFLGFEGVNYKEVYTLVNTIQTNFKNNVRSLYKEKDIKKGYILTKDRFGEERKFNLLSVCSAIIEMTSKVEPEKFDNLIGDIKKASKKSDIPLGVSILA